MPAARLDTVLRFFFRPEGRITRAEFVLGVALLLSLAAAIYLQLWSGDPADGLILLAFALGLPLTIAQFVLVAKRCHDIGLPGTFMLLLLVPVLGLGWLVFLALMPGTGGPNAYGPAPAFSSD